MKPWIFLTNPFLNAASRSYLTGLNLSIYHDSALAANKSDAFILAMYNSYHPIHTNYYNVYNQYGTQQGAKQGETLNLGQMLKTLSQIKIQEWDIKIQSVYTQSTPAYKKLLPYRRGPFQTGSQTERIQAVKSLSTAIGADEALAALKTDVNAFYTLIETALTSQRGSISSNKDLTGNLDIALETMCTAQYADLAGLIQKYADSPEKVAQYFDLKNIRRAEQTIFTGTLDPGEIYSIAKRTFKADDQLILTNLTNTTLKCYLAKAKDRQPGTKFIELAKGELTVKAADLGDVANPYITVQNTTSDIQAKYEIELI